MKRSFSLKRFALAGLFSFGFFLVTTPFTHAQTTSGPQFLVTWKASNSYIPPSYIGKALPSYASNITASLEIVDQGKIVDLSPQTIYWYLNDNLIGGGGGIQTVTFPTIGTPPDSLALKIELPSYAGGYLTHTINIPFVSPQVVLYAPLPDGKFSQNPLMVDALPYFFNTTSTANLSYTWAVNGQTGGGAENPQEAQITLPTGTSSGTNLDVSITVENPIGSTVATADENLVYENQL